MGNQFVRLRGKDDFWNKMIFLTFWAIFDLSLKQVQEPPYNIDIFSSWNRSWWISPILKNANFLIIF